MIKIEELSEKRQKDFADTIKYNEPWMSDELALQHAIGALQLNDLDTWESIGFGSFKKVKWVYKKGVEYYNSHKAEIENYLMETTMKEREEKGVITPVQEELQPTKTEIRAQKKEQEKLDKVLQKMLYGAGDQGWTKEWFNKIYTAFKQKRLSITGMRDEVNLILSVKDLTEEMLTDEERLVLMLYAHPIAYIGKENREEFVF